MLKNKVMLFSLTVNVICIIVIIFLDVLLFKNMNQNTKCVQKETVVSNHQYYHCESQELKDDSPNYKYTNNYDFTYIDGKLTSSSYYVKVMFKDRKIFNEFDVKAKGSSETLKSISDDEHLIKYIDFNSSIANNGESLEDYIKLVESKEKLTCNKASAKELIFF